MKKRQDAGLNYKGATISIIVSVIIFIVTVIALVKGWIPPVNGNQLLLATYFILIFIICMLSFISIITIIDIMVSDAICRVALSRKIEKSFETVSNTLTNEYSQVVIRDTFALKRIAKDVLSPGDIICEAKISDGKVIVKLRLNVETEIFVDQFTDNFNVPN